MIALISTPCIAPGTMPCGIAVLKRYLTQTGTEAKCFFLANEFELHLADESPYLKEVYEQASEVGFDYQNPYFSGLVFGHRDPALLVKRAVRLMFTGQTKLPATVDDEEISERKLQAQKKKEISSALCFCETLRLFCEEETERLLSYSPSEIGFSCLTSQLFVSLYMARLIKQESPSTVIVFGGGAFSRWNIGIYSKFLPNVDHLIAGRDVVRIAKSLHTLRVRRGRPRPSIIKDSKQCPSYVSPDYSDGMSILKRQDRPEVSIPLANSSGCSWGRCTFCPAERKPNTGGIWCPDTVGRFVIETASQNGLSDFVFSEWEINADCATLQRFCEKVHNAGLRLHFWGEFTPSICTRQLFSSMAKCGRWCLQMGVESFSDGLLKLMGKRQGVVDNIKAIRLALEEGIA